jgi:uncharacterized integral membrane protein
MKDIKRCRWWQSRLLFLLLLSISFSAQAQNSDSLRVSLLTVAPRPKAVWTIYGHTALRVYDPARKVDLVLNWGTFDSEKPHFLFKFIEGKTDYFLSASPFQYFISSYAYDGAAMIEQILNIPDSEKDALLEALHINLLPQNTEYRYNFIFDNCTTRPRNIIERFCGGTMIYPKQTQPVTFRQLIHQCTQSYPWMELGIDCIIGSGADSLISYRNELFLPEKLMNALNHSVVKHSDGSEQPVVLASETILHSPDSQSKQLKFWDNPLVVGFIVFIICLALVITSLRTKQSGYRLPVTGYRLPFALLFFIAAIAGCIVAGLNFFSLHPCVQANWNLIWLHPLHFIAFAGFFFRKSYPWIRWYHAVNFVLLSSFLLGWHWIPQKLNLAFIPFILCLWIVSGLQIMVLTNRK